MNKIEVNNFISKIENISNKHLTGHQKDLIFRCFLLGLNEEDIQMVVLEDFLPEKEEYIIASFLDEIDSKYIKEELIPERNIDEIKAKRLDYLMEKFKSTDPSYIELQNNINKLEQLRKMSQKQQEVLSRRLKMEQAELIEIQNAKQKLEVAMENLKARIKDIEEKESVPKIEYIERESTYKKPETLAEKIRFLKTGELEKIEKEESIDTVVTEKREEQVDIISILCNPKFNIKQIKELQQGILDGLNSEEIKKIALPELEVDVMKEMRRFMCGQRGIVFNEVAEKGEVENKKEDISEGCDEIVYSNGYDEEQPDIEEEE